MFQPIKEKVLILNTSEKVSIDSMEFNMMRILPNFNEEFGDLEITLWGNRPNATTLHHQRLIKLEDLIWRPVRGTLKIFTLHDQSYFDDSNTKENALEFMKKFQKDDDEIVTIWITLTTIINEPKGYFWD